jgi:hypothetical protein
MCLKNNQLCIIFLCLILLLCYNAAFAQVSFDDLNKAIRQSAEFDLSKENRIRNLKKTILGGNDSALYEGYSKLYSEYRVFHYDSAFSYAQKALAQAIKIGNEELVNCSRIKLGFVLLSAGLFKEAFDSLQSIPATALNRKCKVEYYTLLARYYYDLADYTMDSYHSPKYNMKGLACLRHI